MEDKQQMGEKNQYKSLPQSSDAREPRHFITPSCDPLLNLAIDIYKQQSIVNISTSIGSEDLIDKQLRGDLSKSITVEELNFKSEKQNRDLIRRMGQAMQNTLVLKGDQESYRNEPLVKRIIRKFWSAEAQKIGLLIFELIKKGGNAGVPESVSTPAPDTETGTPNKPLPTPAALSPNRTQSARVKIPGPEFHNRKTQ